MFNDAVTRREEETKKLIIERNDELLKIKHEIKRDQTVN